MSPPRPLPDKLFFRIGEVADIVGVKPHVLRYWESEFNALKPMKTRGSHRQYRRRDVELAMLIKQLVHDEGYTIAGARKRMRELGHDRSGATLPKKASAEMELRAALLGLREELVSLLGRLDAIAADEEKEADSPHEVTVHRAVPVSRARRDRER
ncbi:MAG: MerR family transcriptional regulator [Sandaracinaceae bacterium]|nr:MerR family transcriptional regulator [Myxococcales bacterium]